MVLSNDHFFFSVMDMVSYTAFYSDSNAACPEFYIGYNNLQIK